MQYENYSSYTFPDLAHDIHALGGRVPFGGVVTSGDALSYLRPFGNISPLENLQNANLLREDLTTAIGHRVLEGLMQGVRFIASEETGFNCCNSAEMKFLLNTDLEYMHTNSEAQQKNFFYPVVITENDQPIAIWKGYGEQSVYGLRSVAKAGLVEGMFSTPTNGPYPKSQMRINKPFKVELTEDMVFFPHRPALFALPNKLRLNLSVTSDQRNVLLTSHDDMVKRANLLADLALRID